MKVAYLILAHGHFDHLAKLINTLASPNTSFFIHMDGRVDFTYELLHDKLVNSAEIYIIEQPLKINWGGFSMIQAILKLISTALQKANFEYISLISGQDFPIKSNHTINSFLENNYGAEFIEYYPLPDFSKKLDLNGGQDRYTYYWLIDELGFSDAFLFAEVQRREGSKRRFPNDWVPYNGSMWFSITQACAQYICDYLSDNPEILLFFKHTLISDELLLPSLLLNSPFKKAIINNNLRYIDWKAGTSHPKILTIVDLPVLQKSDRLFARKFDGSINSAIISELEKIASLK